MNIILKQALHWISIWIFFVLTVFWIVYAATIVNVTTQTINSGDTIWAGWYQDVNDQLSNATGIPTGAVMAFNGTTCPTGWNAADGSGDEKDTSWANTSLDLRGEFVRGLDSGRLVDTGRVLWSWQIDDFKSHVHKQHDSTMYNYTPKYYNSPIWVWVDVNLWLYMSFNTDATWWNETRPRNVALLYCVKN